MDILKSIIDKLECMKFEIPRFKNSKTCFESKKIVAIDVYKLLCKKTNINCVEIIEPYLENDDNFKRFINDKMDTEISLEILKKLKEGKPLILFPIETKTYKNYYETFNSIENIKIEKTIDVIILDKINLQ